MSDHHPTHRRCLLALGSAVLLALAAVTPVLAYYEEGGTKNCVDRIGYVHVNYRDDGWGRGPGSGFITWWDWPPNSGWHTNETNGLYSGAWFGRGETDLNFTNTWPGCRNFG